MCPRCADDDVDEERRCGRRCRRGRRGRTAGEERRFWRNGAAERWWHPRLQQLLDGEAQPDQRRLLHEPCGEPQPDRTAGRRVTNGHGHARIAADGRRRGAEAERRGDHRVESLRQEPVDHCLAEPLVRCLGGEIFRVGEVATRRLGQLKDLLAEELQLSVALVVVELNQVGQRAHVGVTKRRQVLGDLHLELEEQHGQFVVERDAPAGVGLCRVDRCDVDDIGTGTAQLVEDRVDDGERRIVTGSEIAFDVPVVVGETSAVEGSAVEELGVRRRNWLAEHVAARHADRVEQQCRVSHRSSHRPGRVLRMGDRDDAAARHQTHCRFDADQGLLAGGTQDRSVRFRADRNSAQACCRGSRRARRRAARIEIQHVRVAGEASPRAPTVERSEPPEVRPLRQVRFAEDDGARGAQLTDEVCVPRNATADQGERAGRRLHVVVGRNVVFDDHGYPVQWPSHVSRTSLLVHAVGDVQRLGIGLDDCVERGVQPADPGQVTLGQFATRQLSGVASIVATPSRRLRRMARRDVVAPFEREAAAELVAPTPPAATTTTPAAPNSMKVRLVKRVAMTPPNLLGSRQITRARRARFPLSRGP